AFPSLDPTSLQSLVYQKVLADLNAAYRDATTLAPTQIAVCLPGSGDVSVREIRSEWEDMPDSRAQAPLGRGSGNNEELDGSPARSDPAIPQVPHVSGVTAHHSDNAGTGVAGRPSGLLMGSPPDLRVSLPSNSLMAGREGMRGLPAVMPGSPYDSLAFLAGSGVIGELGAGRPVHAGLGPTS